MSSPKVLIGVSGGIAVYKICDVVRLLIKNACEVRIIMTDNAKRFVTPLTFEVLSRNPVPDGMFTKRHDPNVEHIEMSSWCDLFLIAPATANILGKLASGIADDLLTTIAMAVPKEKPGILAPAMNVHMWGNSIVQRNIRILTQEEDKKYQIVEPVEKELACGYVGIGGLADPSEIVDAVFKAVDCN